MKPVMDKLIKSQTRNFYLLSDALIKMVELHGTISEQLHSLPEIGSESTDTSTRTFEDELAIMKQRMLSNILTELEACLLFLREYHEGCEFMFAAIALDPRFEGFGSIKSF